LGTLVLARWNYSLFESPVVAAKAGIHPEVGEFRHSRGRGNNRGLEHGRAPQFQEGMDSNVLTAIAAASNSR